MPRIMTVGSFSILHPDHIALFDALLSLEPYVPLIVGVNSDSEIERTKGFRPALSEQERAFMVKRVVPTATVFVNDNVHLAEAVDKYQPNILAVGSDWLVKDYLAQIGMSIHQLWSKQCNLLFVPSMEHYHSSTMKVTPRNSDVYKEPVEGSER